LAGWHRGNGASVLRIVPYAAVHFTAYERFRALLLDVVDGFERGQEAERAGAQQSGSTQQPAVPSSSAGSPWPNAKSPPGRPVHRHPAVTVASRMLNSVPAGVVGHHRQVSPVLDLVAGSAAGATAVLLTYPLDLVCQCSLMATSP
jgi:hypothetical protein